MSTSDVKQLKSECAGGACFATHNAIGYCTNGLSDIAKLLILLSCSQLAETRVPLTSRLVSRCDIYFIYVVTVDHRQLCGLCVSDDVR